MEREKITEPLVRNRVFTIRDIALGKNGGIFKVEYFIEQDSRLIELPIPKDMLYSMAGLIASICQDISKVHNIREFCNTDGYTPDEVEKIYQDQKKKSKNCE